MAKIWDKGFDADKAVSDFTVGKDRELDLRLAKYDVIGSMAHIKMLAKIGLLTNEEEKVLHNEPVSYTHLLLFRERKTSGAIFWKPFLEKKEYQRNELSTT